MPRLLLTRSILLVALLQIIASSAIPVLAQSSGYSEAGVLSDNRIISSQILDYDLNYRVYTPPGYDDLTDLSVIYIADGQWYISEGQLPSLMDKMIGVGDIDPLIAIFVDNRNPHDISDNRRNSQFWCNPDYVRFYEEELVPEIDDAFKTAANRSSRVILGLSFGGLNAACFGLLAHESFEGIAMQSPAMRPVPSIYSDYNTTPKLPLKIFLSSGTVQDNEDATRRLKSILEEKGYPLHYVEVPFGHNWNNWGPLLDDVLLYFFAGS